MAIRKQLREEIKKHYMEKFIDFLNKSGEDVLIVGSSHAYRGIDPRILERDGITAFNLGSSAQTPINTKVLLHQYLEQINPKLVVYEAYAGTLAIDGVESSLDILSNNKIDINNLRLKMLELQKDGNIIEHKIFLIPGGVNEK